MSPHGAGELASRSDTGPVTLLFTDLVGSTELAQRLGEHGAEAFRRVHFGLLRGPVVATAAAR